MATSTHASTVLAGLDERHRAVEQLAEHRVSVGPLLEAPHVEQPGGDRPGRRRCAVTRVIGRKIRRRGGTSTTSPSTRGGLVSDAQRDDDVAHPPDLVAVGVEDGDPARRAMKTLVAVAHKVRGYRRPWRPGDWPEVVDVFGAGVGAVNGGGGGARVARAVRLLRHAWSPATGRRGAEWLLVSKRPGSSTSCRRRHVRRCRRSQPSGARAGRPDRSRLSRRRRQQRHRRVPPGGARRQVRDSRSPRHDPPVPCLRAPSRRQPVPASAPAPAAPRTGRPRGRGRRTPPPRTRRATPAAQRRRRRRATAARRPSSPRSTSAEPYDGSTCSASAAGGAGAVAGSVTVSGSVIRATVPDPEAARGPPGPV